jgi:hypothetical protein
VMSGLPRGLAQFAKNLKEWLGRAKSDKGKERLYRKGKKAPGQRSVEAIIKIAASTRSHVRVNYKTEKGETLEVELTLDEALKAREQAPAQQTKVPGPAQGPRAVVLPREVQVAIERLHHSRDSSLSPTEVQAVADVVVAVMRASGVGHLLAEIASDLSCAACTILPPPCVSIFTHPAAAMNRRSRRHSCYRKPCCR